MKARNSIRVAGALTIAGLMLTGCLDDKKDRITNFEPGVYKGKMDTSLSDAQERALQSRARLQSGSVSPAGGGGGGKRAGANVRPPTAIDLPALNNRVRNQKSP